MTRVCYGTKSGGGSRRHGLWEVCLDLDLSRDDDAVPVGFATAKSRTRPRPSQRSAEPESSPVTVHRLANRDLGSTYDCPRAATNCTLSLSCHLPLAMGKSQSKLSPEQLADLQKHTYCACVPLPNPSHSQDMPSSR